MSKLPGIIVTAVIVIFLAILAYYAFVPPTVSDVEPIEQPAMITAPDGTMIKAPTLPPRTTIESPIDPSKQSQGPTEPPPSNE